MQTIQLFPALASESTKIRGILDKGRDRRDASRISKRRLPWHLPHHDKPTILPAYQLHHQRRRRTPFDGDSSSTTSLGGYGAGSLMESLSNSSLRKKGSSGSSYCGRNETGSCDVSLSTTTSKKTMESLSASVYDELEPFRLAHRNVIKNRMATKAASDESRLLSRRAAGSKSAMNRRTRQKKSPLETGLAKITTCASSFAWVQGKRCIRGFQRWRMLPIEFKDQLQMALNIYLRPTEAAAVAEFFDIDGVGSVNGEYFVRWFLQAGNNARQLSNVDSSNTVDDSEPLLLFPAQRLRTQAAEQHEEQKLQRERQREEESRRHAANTGAVELEFSQADQASALAVLGKIALSYHDQRTGHDAAHREFACALAPLEFRDQLFRSFGVRLTDQQFAGLFDIVDTNRDRCIDGAEFLRFFFGLGNEERAKEHKQHEVNCRVRARNLGLDNLPPIAPILGR